MENEVKYYYAGIGSRETPLSLRDDINFISTNLWRKGYILRSGGANGADTFFEESVPDKGKEIYLPWKGFNGNKSKFYHVSAEAIKMASKYHPSGKRFFYFQDSVRLLLSRNTYQILGLDLNSPVHFVICWTKDGKFSGGTGQALRIAKDLNIPIYNLYFKEDLEQAKKLIDVLF